MAGEWASRLADRDHSALATLKQMLVASDNRHLDDALGHEQKLVQGLAGQESAKVGMARVQERFDAGETLRDVYGGPRG